MRMKGLSQILYLIIAASVLMIAALSIVFMLDEGLSDLVEFGADTEVRECENQIQQLCSNNGGTVNAPSSCTTETADGGEEWITGINPPGGQLGDVGRINCQP